MLVYTHALTNLFEQPSVTVITLLPVTKTTKVDWLFHKYYKQYPHHLILKQV